MGGRLWRAPTKLPDHVNRLIILGPLGKANIEAHGPESKTVLVDSWDGVLKLLMQRYDIATKVAIIPDGTIQYFK
jgi:hypothetical protein